MAQPIFYVTGIDPKTKNTTLVPATYLENNGAPVLDQTWYARAAAGASLPTQYNADGSFAADQNSNGYLIVPVNYSVASAMSFASDAANSIVPTYAYVAKGFAYGSQDLQRSYTDINGADITGSNYFVPAFTPAASFNLGLITTALGIVSARIAIAVGAWRGPGRFGPRPKLARGHRGWRKAAWRLARR